MHVSPDHGYVGTFVHFSENDYELRHESFRDECCEVICCVKKVMEKGNWFMCWVCAATRLGSED